MATFIDEEGKKKVTEAVKELLARKFDGTELVEIRFYKEYGEGAMELLIWSADGISLDDCERVHNEVSDMLDAFDELFAESYNLKVSSMGLDRLIVTNDDFRRAMGTEIECFGSQKNRAHGVLEAYSDDSIVIKQDNGKSVTLNRNILTKVQPYIRF